MPRFHLPYQRHLIEKARSMRKNPTFAEKKLWQNYLRNLPIRILRQRPIDRFIVDFYCASYKIAIEVDGKQHYTKEGLAYDAERSAILSGYGIKIIRFTNQEVINNFDAVCEQIDNIFNLNQTP
ncbi:MAG: endonuclease domain-containing protein [Prochloraceae cyanobacterium]